jgi:HAD superfamily 5'-nucleotidase-like hydrolase
MLVEHLDRLGHPVAYHRLFKEVSQALTAALVASADLVRKEPGRYLGPRDADLVRTFEMFRSANKRLFLLTNSTWEYTQAILSWLFGDGAGAWSRYFDFVLVDAAKPNFFKGAAPFQEISQVAQVGGTRFFRAGNAAAFQELLRVDGAQVLYMGDHIYDDIICARDVCRWRTAMIGGDIDCSSPAAFEAKTAQPIEVELGHSSWVGRVLMSGLGREFEEHACLMTNRVSNILSYSPTEHFKPPSK